MKYRTLRLSGLRGSAVGLGCMSMSAVFGGSPIEQKTDTAELTKERAFVKVLQNSPR